MELQWKKSARVVAYVDLVLTILSVTGVVIYAVYYWIEVTSDEDSTEVSVKNRTKVNDHNLTGDHGKNWTKTCHDNLTEDDDDDDDDFSTGLVLGLMVGVGVIWIAISVLHVWACTLLLKATSEKAITDHASNLRRARFWKYLNMTLLVFSVIGCIVEFYFDAINFSTLFSPVVIRIGLEFIVWQFVRELKTAAAEENEPLSEYCVL